VAARTVNKIATRVISGAVPKASKMASVDPYHIRRKMPKRAQFKATKNNPAGKQPRAKITVTRGEMSAISMFMAVRKSRAKNTNIVKGKLDMSALNNAAEQGRGQKGVTVGKGRFSRSYPGAFIQNGKARATNPAYNKMLVEKYGAGKNVLAGKHFQVLQRKGKKPYPLKVLKIPMHKAITNAFGKSARDIYRAGGLASQLFEHEVKREINKMTGLRL